MSADTGELRALQVYHGRPGLTPERGSSEHRLSTGSTRDAQRLGKAIGTMVPAGGP